MFFDTYSMLTVILKWYFGNISCRRGGGGSASAVKPLVTVDYTFNWGFNLLITVSYGLGKIKKNPLPLVSFMCCF